MKPLNDSPGIINVHVFLIFPEIGDLLRYQTIPVKQKEFHSFNINNRVDLSCLVGMLALEWRIQPTKFG
jgi:hypothetical protein